MNGKVLVVDDNLVNIEVLEAMISPQGYTVVTATSGAMALERVAIEQPDLVLLDIVMPEMDGYKVCMQLRANPATSLLPVIMITASEEAQKIKALEAGADDFIHRPFDRAELLNRVKSLVRLKQSYDTILGQAARLAELNRTLEARVAEQVQELERVSRLRRYLSPQLAELIISSGDESVLASHRREITVVFCDIRGFSSFAEVAEPEEVMEVLRVYHTALGELIFRFEGTLERFAGDGVMVFFNDPFSCPDPAHRAVRMAVAMRERITELAASWKKRGHDLGFGVGIALGYATLGKIGFQGRFDYAAIGQVTNLAARLCEEAKDGQVLISQRVYAALEDQIDASQVGELTLKGFRSPVIVFNVRGIRSASSVESKARNGGNPGGSLTSLEQEVAVLVARGLPDPEIAEHLGITEPDATRHIDSILRKLGLVSRTQMARWLVDHGGMQERT